jgi:TolB-like protein
MIFPFSVRAGDSPQQTGAVPLSQGIADLADKLAKSVPEGHPMTVAVTDFPDLGGQTCRLGRYVAERLSTLLSQHAQCRLVERHRLDMVLQELKFSMSELVDPAKARKLGQMLGVQGLVVGTVSNVESTLDLDARIIDIQADLSLPGASASIVKDEAVSKMASDCGAALGGPIGQEPPQQPLLPPTTVKPVAAEDFTFLVKSCGLFGETLRCQLSVSNGSTEDQTLAIRHKHIRVIDDSGNEYQCQRVRFGSKEADTSVYAAPFNTLVPRTPTNLVLNFERVSREASKISLLEIVAVAQESRHTGTTEGSHEFIVKIRGIPIAK